METRDEDFETDEALEEVEITESVQEDFHNIVTAPADWTVGSLFSQIGRQIDLNPEFQRRGVWSKKAKSSFIESLFLNIPIPQILLASNIEKKNKFIVLDGKQRLLTISEFLNGRYDDGRKFKLSGLRILGELEGKTWEQIRALEDWSDILLNHTQRTAVLRNWTHESTLYEIFHRLNSGSVKLSPMELRMSLHPGPFLKYSIEKTEEVTAIHRLLRLSRPDKRMADVELFVRHLAFNDDEIEYRGNLKAFLDQTCRIYNERFLDEDFFENLQNCYANFLISIDSAIEIFGKNVCRKWKNGDFENRFNRAVFDIIIGSLSDDAARQVALKNKERVVELYVELSRDNRDFVNSLETTTKSIEATRTRFECWYNAMNDAFGTTLAIPSIQIRS